MSTDNDVDEFMQDGIPSESEDDSFEMAMIPDDPIDFDDDAEADLIMREASTPELSPELSKKVDEIVYGEPRQTLPPAVDTETKELMDRLLMSLAGICREIGIVHGKSMQIDASVAENVERMRGALEGFEQAIEVMTGSGIITDQEVMTQLLFRAMKASKKRDVIKVTANVPYLAIITLSIFSAGLASAATYFLMI